MVDEPRGADRRQTAESPSGARHQPHYFASEPTSPSRPRSVRLDLPDRSISLGTDSSVFSADRIDPGTKTLLVHTAPRPENTTGRPDNTTGRPDNTTGRPHPGDAGSAPDTDSEHEGAMTPDGRPMPDGDLVDVGAGYGPIAITLAGRFPGRTVWAIEPNERARALCAANAEAAGVGDAVRVVSPEEAPNGIRAAAVYSNPPIRIGKDALHELLERWLTTLVPDGEAWLVVQRNLGADSLARWLSGGGFDVERMGSRRGYRVLRVRP